MSWFIAYVSAVTWMLFELGFGTPEFDVARFADAPTGHRDMVGPMWFDRELPACMWRIDGFRVWVTHGGDRVTAVNYCRYAD